MAIIMRPRRRRMEACPRHLLCAAAGVGSGPLGQLRLDYAREAHAAVLNTGHGTMQVRKPPVRAGAHSMRLVHAF